MVGQWRHFETRSAAIDFADNVVRRFCPDKRLRTGIVLFDVVVDGAFQLRHAGKHASGDGLADNFRHDSIVQDGGKNADAVRSIVHVLFSNVKT
jgi:hypothetical protein